MAGHSFVSIKKIQYNAPVILTFSLAAIVIQAMNYAVPSFTLRFFAIHGEFSFLDPLDYFRLISYTLGHVNWEHLFGNLSFLLLLGPLLEEKYGSLPMLVMILLTATFSGLISVLILHAGAVGASGIVFMLIILASIVNVRAGTIPLTFVLVISIFLGREVFRSFQADNISQMGHILGGTCGAVFGFIFTKLLKKEELSQKNIV